LNETGEITVLLVEDEAPIAMAFRQALLEDKRFKFAGNTLGRTNFEKYIRQDLPDIIVVDLYLPLTGKLLSPAERRPRLEEGLWHITHAREFAPRSKIIAMSNYFLTNPSLARQVLEQGADAYLPKHNAPQGEQDWNEWLRYNLWTIFRGTWQPDAEMAQEASQLGLRLTDLSERELEIVCLSASGKSDQQIGEALFITDNTVRSHFKNILDKLRGSGVRNRREVIDWAEKKGLLRD